MNEKSPSATLQGLVKALITHLHHEEDHKDVCVGVPAAVSLGHAHHKPSQHEQQRVDRDQKYVRDKLDEKFVVTDAHAVVHPGAVVIHL